MSFWVFLLKMWNTPSLVLFGLVIIAGVGEDGRLLSDDTGESVGIGEVEKEKVK